MGTSSFLRRMFGGPRRRVDRRTEQLVALCEALLGERGEVSGAALAREALNAYQALDETCRAEFFDVLARDYAPSPEDIWHAADAYRGDPSSEHLIRLQEAVEPPRQELLRRLNTAASGTAALVDMRRKLLQGMAQHPDWASVDADLLHLLRSWFNRGFLRLERIDWRTSAMVLEKLIEYEAVHAVRGWGDLRRRLASDRRCFGFFHPQLPDEPLIFIEVALTHGMSTRVQPLLEVDAPISDAATADCAMFYSITNCQEGLRGISFGNLLIKQVAEKLKEELPHLRTFATLSPIPGLRRWLEKSRVRVAIGTQGEQRLALLALLEQPRWHEAAQPEALQPLLMQLCAYYLVHAKRGEEPVDAVARFHLGNGASLERLNWLGDTSEIGMARSAGMMANYVYRLDEVERNHERFFKEHRVVASRAVEKMARECPLAASPASGTEA